ncbi:MAG: hypothetical protein E7262_05630 [Lachnospiraceae bacterium]|nr:hypothetical protein [Lachnospiraceae bacterium]
MGKSTNNICSIKSNKKRRIIKSLGIVIGVTILISMMFDNGVKPKTVVYTNKSVATSSTSKAEVRTINLGTYALKNPKEVSSTTSYWSGGEGSYIYLGEYYGEDISKKDPLKWRVLSMDSDSTGNTSGVSDSILLMSDKIIDNFKFNYEIKKHGENYYKMLDGKITSIKANDYSQSDLRYWLNSDVNNAKYNKEARGTGLLKSVFTSREMDIIKETNREKSTVGNVFDAGLNKDKLFLLNYFELNNPKYGFAYSGTTLEYNISRRFELTKYAISKGSNSTNPVYQLRTGESTKTENIHYVYDGSIVFDELDEKFSGVVPAMNLDKDKIVFVTKAGLEKDQVLSVTDKGTSVKEWTVAIKSTEGLEAKYNKETVQRVKPGTKVKIDITKLPTKSENYSQFSVMMVDNKNTVIAYGKISDKIMRGTYSIEIPYDVEDGNYTLKIFAEEVNSSKKMYKTDYVSNMVDFKLTVTSENDEEMDALEKEKKLYHEIDAVLYNTDEYSKSGEKGQKLTEEGITVEGWQHTESKYLQIKVKLHNCDEESHVVKVTVPKEVYFVGDVTAIPAGCSSVSFKKNPDFKANGGAVTYDVNNKSGEIKYRIGANTSETTIQLELRYDNVLWDKRNGSSITKEDVIPVDIDVNYEPEKDKELQGGVLGTARINKIVSGSSTGRFGYFVYNTDGYDLSKNNTKDLSIHIIENNQISESLYFDDAILEVHIPYWEDAQKVKHYLKYDLNTMKINKSFFKGNVNYEIVEQSESVIKFRVQNLYYSTTKIMILPLTYPEGIETEELFLPFAGGKLIVNAVSVNGEEHTHFNANINSVKYATRFEEVVTCSTGNKSAYYTLSKAGVNEFGGYYLENQGIAPSCEKTVTLEFPKELLVTTINLAADISSQNIKVKYQLVDENSERVFLDERGMRVSEDSKYAIGEWEAIFANNNYKTGQLDNIYFRLYRDKLPSAHRRYYLKKITYNIASIQATSRLYAYSGQWGLGGTGNFFGYLGKDAKIGGKYNTNVTVKSTEQSNIPDLKKTITTTISKDSNVAYGIDSVSFSSKSINAGESVDVGGSMFLTNYPYGNNQMFNKIKIGLVLSKGVTVDSNNIILYTSDSRVVDVESVTSKDIGNNQVLWVIDADPNLYIGHANEQLQAITKGSRLSFSVRLKTSKRLESTTLFTDAMLYCAGEKVTNASGGSYNWANATDIWDLNQNGSTTDRVGKSYYTNPAMCNIVPSPPSLDIEDSLSVKGKGSIKKGVANVCDKEDIVTYDLNIKSIDDGTASSFQYFIPIPKKSTSRDSYFVLSEKNKSFDFALVSPATITGDEIYTIDYSFEKGISYVEASEISEDKWLSQTEVEKDTDKTWEDVTMVRLRVEGLIEKGVDSTIKLPLKYGGEDFIKDSGQQNVWRSSGYYEFDSGTRVVSGHFKSPGVSALVDYSWIQRQEISFIAKGNVDSEEINAVHNTFPENRENIDLTGFPGAESTQTLKLTDIKVENAEIKSKKFMVENQNTLVPEEANKFFGFTIVMRGKDGKPGTEVDISKGINQDIGKFSGTELPIFDIYMYYGSNYKDVSKDRTVTMTIESDKGLIIEIVAKIYFASKNRIDVINGEISRKNGEDTIVKVFYAYDMRNEILKDEAIEFTIDKTNDVDKVDFAISTSKDFSETDKFILSKYITLTDDRGNIVEPTGNKYKIDGDRRYSLKLSRDFLVSINQAGKTLYLHSHVPTVSSYQEILYLKRRVFEQR